MSNFELRSIPGLWNYFAANDGTIWSNRPWRGRVRPLRIMKPGVNPHGYSEVSLWRPGAQHGTSYTVHRLVALTFHGPCPDGLQVCHLNHVKTDNRPDNLAYGTLAENRAQTVAAGRQAKGERSRRKLTSEQVAEIRGRFAHGESGVVLAKEYNVSYDHIAKIRRGHFWRKVSDLPIQGQG